MRPTFVVPTGSDPIPLMHLDLAVLRLAFISGCLKMVTFGSLYVKPRPGRAPPYFKLE